MCVCVCEERDTEINTGQLTWSIFPSFCHSVSVFLLVFFSTLVSLVVLITCEFHGFMSAFVFLLEWGEGLLVDKLYINSCCVAQFLYRCERYTQLSM